MGATRASRATQAVAVGLIVAALMTFTQASDAAYIDGNLADWGVTPFQKSAPTSPAVYVEENWTGPSYPYGGERYDLEAMYFDQTPTRFYAGIIGSFPEAGLPDPNDPTRRILPGDLLIGIDRGSGFTWEFGIILAGTHKGEIYHNPVLYMPQGDLGIPSNGPGNVDIVLSGPCLHHAQVAWHNYGDLEGFGSNTYGIEISTGWNDLGRPLPNPLLLHYTMGNGNDLLELSYPTVPEPGMLALVVTSGAAWIAGHRRRRGRKLRRNA